MDLSLLDIDHTSFKNDKVYIIPREQSVELTLEMTDKTEELFNKYDVPLRKFVQTGQYTAKELGLPFPKARTIFVGYCGDSNSGFVTASEGAHTHKGIEDPLFNSICVRYNDHLYNSDGSISELMWHEYAHVEDRRYGSKDDHIEDYEALQEIGHGWSFVQACERIGHPEVSARNLKLW